MARFFPSSSWALSLTILVWDPEAQLVEFRITLPDAPGALAKAAAILAQQGVDSLSTESRTLRRGDSAEWLAIIDISKCKCKLEELKQMIIIETAAKEVEFRSFPINITKTSSSLGSRFLQ